MSNDPELRRLFEALKNDEQRSAPLFSRLFRRRAMRPPRRFPRLVGATALLFILIAVPFAIRRFSHRVVGAHGVRPAPPWVGGQTWQAPTDFLLTTPNTHLLRSLPEIGTTPVPLT